MKNQIVDNLKKKLISMIFSPTNRALVSCNNPHKDIDFFHYSQVAIIRVGILSV